MKTYLHLLNIKMQKIPDYEENTQMYPLRNQELLVPGRDPQTILLGLYEVFYNFFILLNYNIQV